MNYGTIGMALEFDGSITIVIQGINHHAFQTIVKNYFTRCMMKSTATENTNLLEEIINLKMKMSELYNQTGPSSSEYIMISIKLTKLMNEYFEEKIENLVMV
jgi:hypothetical protein